MEDETTTGSASTDTGALAINGVAVDSDGNALPETPAETNETADTTTSNTPEETSTEESNDDGASTEEALPAVDDKLRSFAKGQGIDDITELTKREQSLLKSAYDNKSALDRTKATELASVSTITPEQVNADASTEQRDNIRVRNIELRLEAQTWKQNNPEKAALESDMSQILVNDPNKRLLVQEGLLSLDDIYNMAKGSGSSDNDLKAAGKREALESLAGKQQAATPRGSAVNSSPDSSAKLTPQNVDSMVSRMSLEEYQRRLPEINAALNA